MSYNYGGGTGPLVLLVTIVGFIAIAYFVIIRTNFLKNLGKTSKAAIGVGVKIEGVIMIYQPEDSPVILREGSSPSN